MASERDAYEGDAVRASQIIAALVLSGSGFIDEQIWETVTDPDKFCPYSIKGVPGGIRVELSEIQ